MLYDRCSGAVLVCTRSLRFGFDVPPCGLFVVVMHQHAPRLRVCASQLLYFKQILRTRSYPNLLLSYLAQTFGSGGTIGTPLVPPFLSRSTIFVSL